LNGSGARVAHVAVICSFTLIGMPGELSPPGATIDVLLTDAPYSHRRAVFIDGPLDQLLATGS
jgi:hypothetical protein